MFGTSLTNLRGQTCDPLIIPLADRRPALRENGMRGHLALRQGTSSPAPLIYEWMSDKRVDGIAALSTLPYDDIKIEGFYDIRMIR